MRKTLKPSPQIMGVWRSLLVCVTLVPAFVCSLMFRPGSRIWLILTLLWVAIFLFCYLYYLPARFRRLSLEIAEDRFVLSTGVFRQVVRTIAFENIQFLSLRSSPLHRYKKLCSLVMVAPGGRMQMPGLAEEEARRLVNVFFSEQ
ncbi:MAG: PH domain-containing protein [Oscillospiraceae bacterium]|jgi:membrane protein YdbS with pleckstrin-like domain